MTDPILGEESKTLRIKTGFNIASATDLALVFKMPDGTEVVKTMADGVAIGTPVTDPILGDLGFGDYMTFETSPDILAQPGVVWVHGVYHDANQDPPDLFKTQQVKMKVRPIR